MTLALLALLLGAAPDVGIVVGKRSGVSAPLASARASAVRTALGPDLAAAGLDDFSACASKRPCLVKEAQARQWKALVVVETATILSDALVKVAVLSIEDDGREVATASVQAPDDRLVEVLSAAFGKVRAELARLAPPPVVSEPVTKVEPPPRVESPKPPTPVQPSEPAGPPPRVEAVPRGKPAARWLPAAGGAVLLGAGTAFVVASQGIARRLEGETFAEEATPTQLARDGVLFQSLGGVLLGTGAALTVGGLLLALLWPEAPLAPVVALGPAGASVGFVGVFP